MKRVFFCFALFLLGFFCFSQNNVSPLVSGSNIKTANEGFAKQEFRRGVQSYYRGAYNESILQLEKALSYISEDNLILDWLGKAYYSSGLEGTALRFWERASSSGYGGLLLANKIETVKERRVYIEGEDKFSRYSEAGFFSGEVNGTLIFANPVSVVTNPNGTAWVLAYGSNELLLMNVNGVVINRITGPINGFDHPLDIIRLSNKNLLVSEVQGDRLALLNENGKFLRYIGSKGRGVGQVMGPQYLAEDSRNNILVTDYGNRRVCVFDKDGNGLFYFGGATSNFEGLKGPTGIDVINDIVYVADDVSGAIYEFDLSGNFRRCLVEEKTFRRPESMKAWSDYLVICDSNKVFSVDVRTGSLFEHANTGNAPSRLTSAVPDVNGNVLVTDFKANEIYVMTKMQELVGGLFVQIERINADKFPIVNVEVKVENRYRKPVVGLRENNFYFTEDKRPVSNLKFNGAAAENDYADITILIDRSEYSAAFNNENGVDSVVRQIAKSMDGRGTLRIVCAGKIPVVEYVGTPRDALNFSSSALKTPFSKSVPMDLALRLCANDLIRGEKKRAIIIVGSGKIGQDAFNKYNLYETAAFLSNNSIPCLYIKGFSNIPIDEELEYVVDHTQGKEYHIWREEGLSNILDDILQIPVGLYSFSYSSALTTNFGEKYLPIETEVYLLNRSGRDETGYYAPLQ